MTETLEYESKLEKSPFALWLTDATKEGFLGFKREVELALGRPLQHEHFIRVLLDNSDWYIEMLRMQRQREIAKTGVLLND